MTDPESKSAEAPFTLADLGEAWPELSAEERVEAFHALGPVHTDDFFLALPSRDQGELILTLPAGERRTWMRLLAPDDAADVVQQVPAEARDGLLALLDDTTRK